MKAKKVAMVLIIPTLITVFVVDSYYKKSFLRVDRLYNYSHDGFSVNDVVIFTNYPAPYIINKETGLGMELGLNMKEKIDDNSPYVEKNYTINNDNIIESYSEGNNFILSKFDLKTYRSLSITKRNKYKIMDERNQYYSSDALLNLFGKSNDQIYYDKLYSFIDSNLYVDANKISIKPLLHSDYSIDGDEVFYLANDFNIYRYYERETRSIADNAETFLISTDYIYYADKDSKEIVQLIRENNYEVRYTFPKYSVVKVLDNKEYTYILEYNALHIYEKDEKIQTISNINGFDIDDNYIYTRDNDDVIERIDINTLEREIFWNGT